MGSLLCMGSWSFEVGLKTQNGVSFDYHTQLETEISVQAQAQAQAQSFHTSQQTKMSKTAYKNIKNSSINGELAPLLA